MSDLGERVSYEEAALLVDLMAQDPETWIHAKIAGWKFPTTRAALILADSYDLLVAVNSTKKNKRPKPYPRPWETSQGESTTVGRGNNRTVEETKAILARVSGRTKEQP